MPYVRPALVDILTALTEADSLLEGAKVQLFQNDYLPGPNTTLADLTVANYTGYAASTAVTWAAPYIDGVGDGVVRGAHKQFQPSGDTTANIIYGYWIETAGGDLIAVERLPEPVPMASVFDAVTVEPVIRFTQPE